MIETIIKRDGSEEPYIPRKINAWGKWAAKTLGDKVDWSSIVINAVSTMPSNVKSSELQEKLIQNCLDKETWSYYLMAGRLYAAHLHKTIHGNRIPTVKEVHEALIQDGLMKPLDYDTLEYQEVENMINHELDFKTPHFALHYIRRKYSIQNRVTEKEYETQQFVYMRVAMVLSENESKHRRMDLVRRYYNVFSQKLISAPTPNYVNLGTWLQGFISCNLYYVKDKLGSLAAGDHIAYMMTASSAGIGGFLNTRSKGDPVRGGAIEHQGRIPLYAVLGKAVKAMMQGSRGGACTTYFSAYDPEAETIAYLRNPRSTEDKKNRDLHYSMETNKFFAERVAKNQEVFKFNIYTAPKLMKLFFSPDYDAFKAEYERLEADPTFKKEYISARNLILIWLNEGLETGVAYLANIDEMNRHTPFKDTIHSSNLCSEISEPTEAYDSVIELYSDKTLGYVKIVDTFNQELTLDWNNRLDLINGAASYGGMLKVGDSFISETDGVARTVSRIIESKPEPEVALCALAAIPYDHIDESDEETYQEVMYLALKMIDYCIYNTEYKLPHIGVTAKNRMNAGVGILGVATHMARKGLRYDTKEGREEIHRIGERHMYHAIKASLRIARERGCAPWIHKTKWVDGWLPIDTYKRAVDELGDFEYRYDWETLREEIKEQGGIGHSCLISHQPNESSSKAVGSPNGIYPVRDKTLVKTDGYITVRWAAPDEDDQQYQYQSAWDIDPVDMIKAYSVFQKFTDQAISADLWLRIKDDEKVSSKDLLNQYLTMVKYGMKTRYYLNNNVTNGKTLAHSESIVKATPIPDREEEYCEGCAM